MRVLSWQPEAHTQPHSVREQIETQSRAFRPSHRGSSSITRGSRTRSISRMRPSEDPGAGRKMSAPNALPTIPSPMNPPPSSFSRRPSADTILVGGYPATGRSTNGPPVPGSSKSSLERTRTSLERLTGKKSMERSNSAKAGDRPGRSMKLFRKGSVRASTDNGPAPFPSIAAKEAQSGPDGRSTSSLSDGTRRMMLAFQQGPAAASDAGDDVCGRTRFRNPSRSLT
jgi:hypothetical protein